jgi:hypothetical protein
MEEASTPVESPNQDVNNISTAGISQNIDNTILANIGRLKALTILRDNAKTNLKKQYLTKKINKVKKNIISLSTASSYFKGTLKVKEPL